MKKIFGSMILILTVCLSAFAFAACGEQAGGQTGEPVPVSVVTPTGAPFAALADMWDENVEGTKTSYKVITEENVRQTMLAGEADFIIAPLNVGNAVHTAFANGQSSVDYRLINVTSWGVLYYVTNDTEYRAREDCASAEEFLAQFDGQTVQTIGEQAIPGQTAKYLFEQADASVTLQGTQAANIQQTLISADASSASTTAVFAQPALTAVQANATGKPVRVPGSVSDIYKEITGDEFPMAGMFVRTDVYEKHPAIVSAVDARVKTSVDKFNSDIQAVADKIAQMENAPLPAAILPKAYSAMNVQYKTASESKTAVTKLLTNIGSSAREDLFLTLGSVSA